MTPKLPGLRERFVGLYKTGATYSEISVRLGINVQTIMVWRKKLGLPERRLTLQQGPQLWSDTPISYRMWPPYKGGRPRSGKKTPREILLTISTDLFLSPGDIKAILGRTMNLINQRKHIGKQIVLFLLAETFLYLRSKAAERPPVGVHKFANVCQLSGYDVSVNQIVRNVKDIPLISFPREPNAAEKLARQKIILKNELGLSDDSLGTAIKVAEQASLLEKNGRSPSPTSVAAAAVYLGTKFNGQIVTQRELSNHFGVSEVTIRNVSSLLESVPEIRSILGPEGDTNGENMNAK